MTTKLQAPPEVVAQFGHWQLPTRGNANPENQTNAVWSWLIQTQAWPHAAHKAAGSGEKRSPGWSFSRFGQSETKLPDGTIVYIGGEHEDHYDPDFYIYNDVVVVGPDGSIAILDYPTDIFPPTDFHSATLLEDEILIIGGLRHPGDRDPRETLVFRLWLSDFSMHRVVTQGEAPPWLYGHQAELDPQGKKILCSGGQVAHQPTERAVENLTTWEFDLVSNSWSALETKPFQRWLLVREDEGYNDLWGIEQVVRSSRSTRESKLAARYQAKFEERGHLVDAELFDARFAPPIPHRPIEPDPDSKGLRAHRILVDDVIVRIEEDMHQIVVTVEGQLSSDLLKALERHGLETYRALEGVPYKSMHL